MRSSELARMAGVTVRTLRHYHAIGLLAEPERSANGYRDYAPEDLLRVLRIRQLASLGFPLERVAGMLDELDAERGSAASTAPASASADELLQELDRALAGQIAHLEEQRRLIARLRARDLEADFPERSAGALAALERLEDAAAGSPGFLSSALTDSDRLAMGIAAHLYTDSELAEIERTFNAIVDRGLVDEYRRVSALVNALPATAGGDEREEAVDACLAFLERVSDCFEPGNWLRADEDYDLLLDETTSASFNAAQIEVSDEVFGRFAALMAQRATLQKCNADVS